MVPPADGFAAVVRKYCVRKVAVYVVAVDGPVTVWDAAPPSDQLAKAYCVAVAPAWVAAASVWLDPTVHWNEHGDVQAVPSTVSDNPAGELATVTAAMVELKLAVTVAAAFIVMFCGVVVPVSAPAKPVNW